MMFKYGLPHPGLYLPTPYKYVHTVSVEGDRDPIVPIVLFHKFTLKEILFSAMVPILVLLLPSLAWGQSKCGPYTTNDMLGPYFEVCHLSVLAKVLLRKMPRKTRSWRHPMS